MNRKDFLAIIPALSAFPLLGKSITKTEGGIFIEKPVPKKRAIYSSFALTRLIQRQPVSGVNKLGRFSIRFNVIVFSVFCENDPTESDYPITNSGTLSRLVISFCLRLKLRLAKLVCLIKNFLIGENDFNRIVQTNSFAYFCHCSTEYRYIETTTLLSKIFLIGVYKIRLFLKNAYYELETAIFLAKTQVVLIEIFLVTRLTNFTYFLIELLQFRNKKSCQTTINRNQPSLYKLENLVSTTIFQYLYYDFGESKLAATNFFRLTEISRFNRIIQFIKPCYLNFPVLMSNEVYLPQKSQKKHEEIRLFSIYTKHCSYSIAR